MKIEVRTAPVAIRPELRCLIDDWIRDCRKRHPDVRRIELRLAPAARGRVAERAEVLATAGRGRRRAAGEAPLMSVAVREALAALEGELLVHEAVARPVGRVGA